VPPLLSSTSLPWGRGWCTGCLLTPVECVCVFLNTIGFTYTYLHPVSLPPRGFGAFLLSWTYLKTATWEDPEYKSHWSQVTACELTPDLDPWTSTHFKPTLFSEIRGLNYMHIISLECLPQSDWASVALLKSYRKS
jgi:hypothetical protein